MGEKTTIKEARYFARASSLVVPFPLSFPLWRRRRCRKILMHCAQNDETSTPALVIAVFFAAKKYLLVVLFTCKDRLIR